MHGDLCGLQGLQLDDGLHREDARKDMPRRQRHHRSESGRQRHIVQGTVQARHHDRLDKGIHRHRHHRHERRTAAPGVRAARHRSRPLYGQRQADRRDIRREVRRSLHTAHIHHRLPHRDVAADQAPPQQPRADRTLRTDGQRQRAGQRLLRAQRSHRPV